MTDVFYALNVSHGPKHSDTHYLHNTTFVQFLDIAHGSCGLG